MSKRRHRSFGTIFKRRGGYVLRWRVEGRRIERHFSTRQLAEQFLARVSNAVANANSLGIRPVQDVPFESFAADYLKHVERTHKRTTVESDRHRLDRISRFWRGRLVSDLNEADVARLLDHVGEQRKKALSPATRNRYLALVSKLFERAVLLGQARTNPVKSGGFKRQREAEAPVPFLSPEEQERLIAAQPPTLRDLVTVALDTGMRRSELLRLEWPEIDFGRGVVRVLVSKNGESRELPLTSRALASLRERSRVREPRALRGPERVFSEWQAPDAETYHDRRRLVNLFRAAARVARLARCLRFHDLRHCYAVNLVRAGVPLPDVSRLLGHKTRVMVLRYARHAPADSAALARERLERYLHAPTKNAEQKEGSERSTAS